MTLSSGFEQHTPESKLEKTPPKSNTLIMPLLRILFNIPRPAAVEPLTKKLSALTAELLGKPEAVVMVVLQFDQVITLGGAAGPAALIQINSIGKISPEENLKYTKGFISVLGSDLHVPADRIFLNFTDMEASNWGWNNLLVSHLG
eukprot:m.225038 g.225038  ORF g.225038 m.225038 type:complete len:146 (+) comp16602_c0_seq1:148-585(+)